jgi:hypothetical protein
MTAKRTVFSPTAKTRLRFGFWQSFRRTAECGEIFQSQLWLVELRKVAGADLDLQLNNASNAPKSQPSNKLLLQNRRFDMTDMNETLLIYITVRTPRRRLVEQILLRTRSKGFNKQRGLLFAK